MTPGDVVVCVNTGRLPDAKNGRSLRLLQKGAVYTIEKLPWCWNGPGFGLVLAEIQRSDGGCWHPDRFRPCRKTDIGALAALLKEREREEA
jgi:hypothetical protein